MAEIAGLVVGGVALASLFSTCVECFEDIEFARQYASDYEVSVIQIDLLKTRLDLWGRTVWVEKDGTREVVQIWRDEWRNVGEAVGKALGGISETLKNVELLKDKYATVSIPLPSAESMVAPAAGSSLTPTVTRTSKAFNELHDIFNKNIKLRKKQTSVVKKSAWAIHDRAKFGELISTLSAFLDSLEKISEQLGVIGQLRREFEQEITSIRSLDSLQLLDAAAENMAPSARAAHDTPANTMPQTTDAPIGHKYINAIVRQRAIQINGDVDIVDNQLKSGGYEYDHPEAVDDSTQVNGRISAEAFKQLLNSRRK